MSNFKNHGFFQRGSSLLEVIAALFILGVGLLGVLALQVESIKYNQQAYASTQALFVANDIVEQMRMKASVLVDDNPELSDVFIPTDWHNVSNLLPGGAVEVVKTSATDAEYKISISYDQQVLENDKSSLLASDADKTSVRVNYVLFTRL
jgi:type IV pilus assembly protein PilV